MGRKICLKQRICFIPVLALLSIFAHAQQYNSIFTFNTVETLFPVLNEKIQVVHIPAPEFVKGVKQPVFSLNGNWQFTANINGVFDGKKHTRLKWNPTTVPSEWYMESFNVIPGQWAGYYKEFTFPSDWKNKKIFIRFGAVESECRIYLNGKYAGGHTGSMTQVH